MLCAAPRSLALLLSAVAALSIDAFPVPETLGALLSPDRFKAADLNHDGKLTFDEFLHLDQRYIFERMVNFITMDANKDEKISAMEFNTFPFAALYNESASADVSDEKNEVQKDVELEKATYHVAPLSNESDESVASDEKNPASLDVVELRVSRSTTIAPLHNLEEIVVADDDTSDHTKEKVDTAQPATSRDLSEAFEVYDEDNNGKLDADELLAFIQDYMEYAVRRSTKTIIQKYDADKDGALNLKELVQLYNDRSPVLMEPLVDSLPYDDNHESDENDYGFRANDFLQKMVKNTHKEDPRQFVFSE